MHFKPATARSHQRLGGWPLGTLAGASLLCLQSLSAQAQTAAPAGKDPRACTWAARSGDATLKWQVNKWSMVFGRAARGLHSGAIGAAVGNRPIDAPRTVRVDAGLRF